LSPTIDSSTPYHALTRTLALSNCLTKDSRTAAAARRAGLEDVEPLGHKSASITLDRYGHLFPEELDHLADRLDRLHAQAAVYPACTDAPTARLEERKGAGH
jgi:hypothetical protein